MLSISVENVSKLYHLGTIDRKILWREAAARLGLRSTPRQAEETLREEFWALKDVSFEIPQGETVGIIGANGAGKSTLLKILTRITTPTTGTVKIAGRIGSLLEVGTGFNPEMTGRENVYLNGAIQGMKKPEIDSKFNDIVGFAGVEKFIDTPVKRYSSGMYVRLAFSVAAFLRSEILIVDEVLSVGDQSFQNRCIQRLQDIIREGRTVLFVSHGAGLIRKICQRAICLKNGRIICDDEPSTALTYYQNSVREQESVATPDATGVKPGRAGQIPGEIVFCDSDQPGDHIVKIRSCRVTNASGHLTDRVSSTAPLEFSIEFSVLESGHHLRAAAFASDETGNILFWTCDNNPEFARHEIPPGDYRASFVIPADFLMPGVALFSGGIGEANAGGISHALASDALQIAIEDDFSETSIRGAYTGPLPGFVLPRLRWTTTPSSPLR